MIPNWYISLARTNLAPPKPLTWNEAFDVGEGLDKFEYNKKGRAKMALPNMNNKIYQLFI
jgi:hypothetical protein